MIDCETLGTASDSVILSIALLQFELEEPAPRFGEFLAFYPSIKEQVEDLNRYINPDTVEWWSKQPMEAREWLEARPNTIHEIYRGICSVINDQTKVWARGTDFDFPLISSFLADYKLALGVPWKYGNVRDVRTIADEFPILRKKPDDLTFVKHRAKDDCMAQVWSLWERWPL
jgi:hypothetical protein